MLNISPIAMMASLDCAFIDPREDHYENANRCMCKFKRLYEDDYRCTKICEYASSGS